ncbi:Uu.00g050390.m01.CDS01 [Anthostomella pinea]|uniref:Uu.00g050390.m01.CDS01 n=1 Tax=Anthostomella pinea TaxID=933095 RepID=A0AAI8YK83_9PEZI|nr:Uu.00g050390.m01.CDS01 [Anthostomella pinea]
MQNFFNARFYEALSFRSAPSLTTGSGPDTVGHASIIFSVIAMGSKVTIDFEIIGEQIVSSIKKSIEQASEKPVTTSESSTEVERPPNFAFELYDIRQQIASDQLAHTYPLMMTSTHPPPAMHVAVRGTTTFIAFVLYEVATKHRHFVMLESDPVASVETALQKLLEMTMILLDQKEFVRNGDAQTTKMEGQGRCYSLKKCAPRGFDKAGEDGVDILHSHPNVSGIYHRLLSKPIITPATTLTNSTTSSSSDLFSSSIFRSWSIIAAQSSPRWCLNMFFTKTQPKIDEVFDIREQIFERKAPHEVDSACYNAGIHQVHHHFAGFERVSWEDRFKQHEDFVAKRRGRDEDVLLKYHLQGHWLIKGDDIGEDLRLPMNCMGMGSKAEGSFDWDVLEGVMHFARNLDALPHNFLITDPEEDEADEVDDEDFDDEDSLEDEVNELRSQVSTLQGRLASTEKKLEFLTDAMLTQDDFNSVKKAVEDMLDSNDSGSSPNTHDTTLDASTSYGAASETGEGEIQLDRNRSQQGYIDFEDGNWNVFHGLFQGSFLGKDVKFRGYQISDDGGPPGSSRSWEAYSEEAHEKERVGRWR